MPKLWVGLFSFGVRQSPLMPSRKKIDMEKVRASLNIICPKCGRIIEPQDIKRVSWEEILCPDVGNRFDVRKRDNLRKRNELDH
jgi:hypothetical protein